MRVRTAVCLWSGLREFNRCLPCSRMQALRLAPGGGATSTEPPSRQSRSATITEVPSAWPLAPGQRRKVAACAACRADPSVTPMNGAIGFAVVLLASCFARERRVMKASIHKAIVDFLHSMCELVNIG